jgi:hypothetical protein
LREAGCGVRFFSTTSVKAFMHLPVHTELAYRNGET